jgi:transposase
MCAELGITEVIDKATRQDPARRMVTAGHAVTAMVLNGLGCVNQPRSLVPHFFPNKPRSRLIAPGMQASHLNDDPRGRALETLYAYGVTALSSLIAAPAAKRLGLAPTCTPLASPSFPVAGRSHSAPEPEAEIMPIPRGSRRDQRPDLHHGRLELIVEPQAGLPLLLQPLSGHSSDAHACGQGSKAPLAQWQTTDGLPDRVADRALSSADHLQKFAETHRTWLTRVPATLRAAHQVLAQADPQTMAPLTEGDRSHGVPSRDGGIAQRWLLVYSAHRHVQAQRPGDKPRRKPGQQAGAAFQTRRRMTLAWDADAPHALATCTPG